MSSLGRSLKKQTPLSPRSFRPRSTPLRRTYSSTADVQALDEPPDTFVLSGTNTPAFEDRPDSRSSRESDVVSPISPLRSSPRHCTVLPINIEMPQSRKSTRVATSTPPEPLSGRGDRIGGYFPFHEDVHARVQRTHPFVRPSSTTGGQTEAGTDGYDDGKALNPNLARSAASSRASPYDTTPVTSYIPSGVHDSSLPMGKYYPSNYEKRKQQMMRSPPPPGTGTKSDSAIGTYTTTPSATQGPRNESDVKSKLQQYQRDMIAQATLAMGSAASATKNGKGLVSPTGMALNGVSMRNQSFSGVTPAKPISPRLLPLGSPGPVTPMELESSGGSYLDKGLRPSDEGGRGRNNTRSPPRTTRAF